MNTFLPYPSFTHSLAVLDRERLGKQRLEARQLMTALRAARHNRKMGWSNHPATKMWEGHEAALAVYFTLCVNEWIARGYNNTIITPYDENWKLRAGEDSFLPEDALSAELPAWVGSAEFHASHRSNLLRKNAEHYGVFGWKESPDLEYVWPVN